MQFLCEPAWKVTITDQAGTVMLEASALEIETKYRTQELSSGGAPIARRRHGVTIILNCQNINFPNGDGANDR